MLTIKQITENTEAVLRGLEKKHFKNAKETIDQVIALNNKRRSTQNELDKNLAEVNSLSRTIGQLMKEGKKEEAETARARVAELKEGNKELDAAMTQAATDMQNVLYTIPNIPYDSVPLVVLDQLRAYPSLMTSLTSPPAALIRCNSAFNWFLYL